MSTTREKISGIGMTSQRTSARMVEQITAAIEDVA